MPSFSFYLRSYEHQGILSARRLGGSLTISGPKSPDTVRELRQNGFEGAVLLDGEGYKSKVTDVDDWLNQQDAVGADRLLLPGAYVDYTGRVSDLALAVKRESEVARLNSAVMVLALHSTWIGKKTKALVELLQNSGVPVALVMAHSGDPLAANRNVAGLRALAKSVPDLLVLRTDHGGFGALAFGATHVSIGLTAGTRHMAIGGGGPAPTSEDKSLRVFVRQAMAWYRSSRLLAWETAGIVIGCDLPCCGGQPLSRFFASTEEAYLHNMTALANLGGVILQVDAPSRPTAFKREVAAAVRLYVDPGPLGLVTPGSQLTAWALA